jgi:hypothetical protein
MLAMSKLPERDPVCEVDAVMQKGKQTYSLPASKPAELPSTHPSLTADRSPWNTAAVVTYGTRGSIEVLEEREKGNEPKLHEVAATVLTSVHLGVDLFRLV